MALRRLATLLLHSRGMSDELRPRAAAIKRKLEAALNPTHLHIIDDSAKHAGHAGNPGGGPNAETHFRVDVVAAAFEGKTAVARHRAIYAALGDDFKAGLHALAIKARTPAEAAATAAATQGAAGG